MEKIFTERVMHPGKTRKLPGLTVAVDDVLIAAQLAEAHGSPGVELLGGDAHLTAKAELSAVGLGNSISCGICHTFSADGRCVSLIKILFTNECIFNCSYCQNNCNSDVRRAAFTPEEVCELTMEFYRRNYIEGLFLSSGIMVSPNYTMELLYQTLYKLRTAHHFNGYIHVKAIPGADPLLIEKTGFLADRMSINLELPTADSLKRLAPCKSRNTILKPMRMIQNGITENKNEVALYRHAPKFVPAGQSTQMIIGATPENDYQIVSIAENLYQKFDLKRVFYSAFVNVTHNSNLPALPGGPPLLRLCIYCNPRSFDSH